MRKNGFIIPPNFSTKAMKPFCSAKSRSPSLMVLANVFCPFGRFDVLFPIEGCIQMSTETYWEKSLRGKTKIV